MDAKYFVHVAMTTELQKLLLSLISLTSLSDCFNIWLCGMY
jgi:hypothetical protein